MIGRQQEKRKLDDLLFTEMAELLAVIGRRGVGGDMLPFRTSSPLFFARFILMRLPLNKDEWFGVCFSQMLTANSQMRSLS